DKRAFKVLFLHIFQFLNQGVRTYLIIPREPRCCAPGPRSRREVQGIAVAILISSRLTPSAGLGRATRRDRAFVTHCCVARRSFGTTKLHSSLLALYRK